MRRTPFVLPIVAALACSATIWPITSVKVNSYVPDLYTCAAAGARSMKYKIYQSDSSDGRFEARRAYPLNKEGPDVDEYGRADVLTVSIVKASKDTTGSLVLQVQAGTLSQHNTRRGPTDEAEAASPAAKDDAKTIVTRCAST